MRSTPIFYPLDKEKTQHIIGKNLRLDPGPEKVEKLNFPGSSDPVVDMQAPGAIEVARQRRIVKAWYTSRQVGILNDISQCLLQIY